MTKIGKRSLAVLTAGAMLLTSFNMPFAKTESKAAAKADMTAQESTSSYGLSNPAMSDGTTTWDCIYLGNYWQEDTNGDGTADQNDEKQPIKWRVLSVDGNDAFVVADRALDRQLYNEQYKYVTWETCTLRTWLNGTFINNAFSTEEQSAIKMTTVVNEDNIKYGTSGGNTTSDKIFLLSQNEVKNPKYGFDSDYDAESETRQCKPSAYAVKNCCWWLRRSPGDLSNYAAFVDYVGWGHNYGFVYDYDVGVRPALHMNLSSSSWKYAGKMSSDSDSSTTTAKPSSAPDTDKVDASEIAVSVSDYDDLSAKGLEGAAITIDGIGETTTDADGKAQLENTLSVPSDMKKIQVKKEGYRDYIYYTTLVSPELVNVFVTNRQSISMKKKQEGDDINPYVSSIVYYSDEIAKTCGGQHFAASDRVTFRACGVWNTKKPGYYQLYRDGQDGCVIDSEDGIFRIDIGKDLKGKGDLYIKMISEDGTESQPERLYITVQDGETESAGDGGIPILNESGESGLLTAVPFLNNDKLSFDLGSFKSTIKRDGAKVRIMLGKSKSGDVFKDEEWETWKKFCESQPTDLSLSQWKNIFSSDNLTTSWTGSAKVKATGYGWLENDLSADSTTPLTGGIQIVIDASTSFKQQYVVGVVPVYMEQTFGVNGAIEGKVTFDTKQNKFGGSTKLKVTPYFSIGGGAGVLYVATIGAEGSASMPTELEFPKGLVKSDIEGELKLKASVLGFDYSQSMLKATYPLYPGVQSKEVKKLSKRLLTNTGISQRTEKSGTAWYDMSCYTLPEKNSATTTWYGQSTGKKPVRKSSGTASGLKETLLQSGTSELTEPVLVQEGDTILAVFLTEDSSRETIQRTKLVYTRYDKSTGEWSSPLPVCEDGTGDFLPELSASNGKIAVSWLNYDKGLSDQSSMKEALESSELCCAVWDETTGTFQKQEETISSSLSNTYNSSHPYVDADGQVILTGLKNTGADIFGTSGDNVLFMKGISNGNAIEREFTLSQGLPVSYDVTGTDGVVTAAVCLDTDKDLTTLEDREIYLFSSDGTVKKLTDNHIYDSAPRYAEYQGKQALYWYSEDGYHICEADGAEHTIEMQSGETFSENFTVVNGEGKKDAIVWSAADESGIYQLAACMYDEASGEWSRQVLVSDSEDDIFRPSGYYNEDGEMELIYRKGSRTDVGRLYCLQVDRKPDIQVENAYISDGGEEAGKTTKVYVGVCNKGTKKITDYTISVDGQQTEGTTELLPGETKLLEADYQMPESLSYSEIPVEVTVAEDTDTSNNSYLLKTGFADLSLSTTEETREQGKIVHVAVQNTEAVSTDAVLEVRKNTKDGELVTSVDLGTLAQDEIVTKDFIYECGDKGYDIDANALYYVVTSSAVEKYESNNYDYSVFKEFSEENQEDKPPVVTPTPIPAPTQSPLPTTPSPTPAQSPLPTTPSPTTMPTKRPMASVTPAGEIPSATPVSAISSEKPFDTISPSLSTGKTSSQTTPADILPTPSNMPNDDTVNHSSTKTFLTKTTLKSVKNIKGRKLTAKWKKASNADGYQIQYAPNKKFKKAKSKTVKSTSVTLKKLKKKTTYFVRVRAYKAVDGKKVYGKWSSVKKVRIKK